MTRQRTKILEGKHYPFPMVLTNTKSAIISDFYHVILQCNWLIFMSGLALTYFAFNIFFAMLYYIGDFGISNAEPTFWNCFVFSIQTSSTIGYGLLSPINHYTNILVTFQAALSLLFTAIATGLTFAKFSRPTSRVIFSKNILVTTFDGQRTLMFRVGNERTNHIVHAKVSVVLAIDHITQEGIPIKKLHDIALIRSDSPLISLTWTVMHVIDGASPLYGLTIEELQEHRAMFIISIKGIDDTFAQTIHSKHYYQWQDIVFNRHFENMMTSENQQYNLPEVNFENFHKLSANE
ncbi:MAG: ion channel [Bdellovibrionota bacterium]|nr:ATP-sensitive inward rectifier potassium channel 10 [Deltaproteobacteria bacterium]